ncbi:MAG: DUF1328 domain-containing protein [Terriglobales bacterium]
MAKSASVFHGETRRFGTVRAGRTKQLRAVGAHRIFMLVWALVFLIIAIIAAVFGFGLITAAAIGFAKILFVLFLILFIISLIAGLVRRGRV